MEDLPVSLSAGAPRAKLPGASWTPVGPPVSTDAANEAGGTISNDGRLLIFRRSLTNIGDDVEGNRLWMTTRADWDAPWVRAAVARFARHPSNADASAPAPGRKDAAVRLDSARARRNWTSTWPNWFGRPILLRLSTNDMRLQPHVLLFQELDFSVSVRSVHGAWMREERVGAISAMDAPAAGAGGSGPGFCEPVRENRLGVGAAQRSGSMSSRRGASACNRSRRLRM